MIAAEFYKLRTSRNPILYATALLVGSLIPSIVLIWYSPKSSSAYLDAFTETYVVLTILVAVEFGGWLLGSEYRQGTVKRLLVTEPGRMTVLAGKWAVGASSFAGVLALTAVVGWSAARLVGSGHDAAVPWNGRSLLAAGTIAVLAATVAYSLSAITRSDSFAKVGTLALILVLDPLLTLVPTLGDYALGSAVDRLYLAISGEVAQSPVAIGMGVALVTLGVWLTAFVAAASVLFSRRDV